MANMIVASSKPLIRASSSPIPPKPRLQIPQFSLPKSHQIISISSKTLKSLSLFAATALSYIPPSLAEELAEEKGKAELFDFNLTLLIQAVQFLTLMFILDKIYFSPLGKFMDERDASIKAKLAGVESNAAEVKELEEKADAVMAAARAEITTTLNKMQKETTEEGGCKKNGIRCILVPGQQFNPVGDEQGPQLVSTSSKIDTSANLTDREMET